MGTMRLDRLDRIHLRIDARVRSFEIGIQHERMRDPTRDRLDDPAPPFRFAQPDHRDFTKAFRRHCIFSRIASIGSDAP